MGRDQLLQMSRKDFLYLLHSFLLTQKKENVHFIQWHSFLPPANEVCEGYVFTDVCLATGGGLSVSVQGRGSLSRGRGLCPGRGSLSRGGGPLSREGGSLSRGGGSKSGGSLSIQGRGLCPGEWGLCLGDLCPGGLCPGGLCSGGLCPGSSLSRWGLCQGNPPPRQRPPIW